MRKKIFIDGCSGTTGLRIHGRLAERSDIELLELPQALRRDPQARKAALNSADIVFLCLPDAAAREAAAMVENPKTVVLDTSTAHRTAPGWVYGFPELGEARRRAIRTARRIAVPGCHASGFIALTAPLVQAGLLRADSLLSCHSITGYSGGGKAMIADYEARGPAPGLGAPRLYGVEQQHKHLREMQTVAGLCHPPVFCPVVAPFYSGMLVTVGLFAAQLSAGAGRRDAAEAYRALYTGRAVHFVETMDDEGFIRADALAGTDRMEIAVLGGEERMVLAARYDNLGKGASGAAIQCMNLVLGASEDTGLAV